MTTGTSTGQYTPHTTIPAPLDRPGTVPTSFEGNTRMLIYEELARARIREMHQAVEGRRHARRARAARRWDRIARWAENRSGHYRR
ncbi:hypothetical protein [Qaidamihabitans albus]|uniref:hypothetical protein n=1 Tax=Qaidamihabitans albus TaxID=2795733 RepID=UPI0018F1EF86|nr:hypothetical protein [Qaidamihabitans albus]